jgi:hypothetical protein
MLMVSCALRLPRGEPYRRSGRLGKYPDCWVLQTYTATMLTELLTVGHHIAYSDVRAADLCSMHTELKM